MAVSKRFLFVPIVALTLAGCGSREPASKTIATAAPAPVNAASEAAPASKDTRPVIAVFGDSLTAGFGVEPGKSYPDDLQRLIDAAGYRFRIVNLGVSGDTTTDGVERLPNVLASNPKITIVEFGGNDGLRGLPVESARKNLATIIEALQKRGSRILLAGMTLPRNYGPDYIHAFEQVYADLAKTYKIARIPFLLEGVGGHPDLMQPDGIHPTAEGAEIVARNVMKDLQPLLRAATSHAALPGTQHTGLQ